MRDTGPGGLAPFTTRQGDGTMAKFTEVEIEQIKSLLSDARLRPSKMSRTELYTSLRGCLASAEWEDANLAALERELKIPHRSYAPEEAVSLAQKNRAIAQQAAITSLAEWLAAQTPEYADIRLAEIATSGMHSGGS